MTAFFTKSGRAFRVYGISAKKYVLGKKNASSPMADNNIIHIESRRVGYLVEASATAIEQSLLPALFADLLRLVK